MASTTPKFGLRYPGLTDAPNVPQDLGNLATDVENLVSTGIPYTLLRKTTGLPASVSTAGVVMSWSTSDEQSHGSMWSSSSNPSRLIAPTGWGGVYQVNWAIGWPSGSGVNFTWIFKNGAGAGASATDTWRSNVVKSSGGGEVGTGVAELRLAAGDYVELWLTTSVATTIGQYNNRVPWISMRWLRS